MYIHTITHDDITFSVSGSYNPNDDTYTLEARSTSMTASILLTPSMEGIVTFLTYLGSRVLSVCYLPDSNKEEIAGLGATTTLFVTKTGMHVPAESKLTLEYVDVDALQFMNPRDMVYYVIPESKLSKGGNVSLSENWARILTAIPLTHFTTAIYSPVQNAPSLYMSVSEGDDCLQFTDMSAGYVVKVTYIKNDETITEYISVG